ncbi:MAG: phosphoribosylformylglycinamidine synthase I [Candidatus Methanomethylicaceae archaeon]
MGGEHIRAEEGVEGGLMDLERAKACIARVGGTNCDLELKVALEDLGLRTEILHMKEIVKKGLAEYQLLVFPGGFSYGDYVRAGAIWGKEVHSKIKSELQKFIEENKLVLGICNGFQVMIEAGILPDGEIAEVPKAALANNASSKYECRWVYVRVERGGTPFTEGLTNGEILRIPVGHGEGRFLPESEEILRELIKDGCVLFRYALPSGDAADGEYPYNPNGSVYDIAGICNKRGNIMGMMPHPERAFFGWQLPEGSDSLYGDGKKIFQGIIKYLEDY